MTKEVMEFAREQLLQARRRQEEKRRRLRAAIAFREEELKSLLPTATATLAVMPKAIAAEEEERIVTAATDVATIGTTPVGFGTFTSAVPLTPTNAGLVTSPSTSASVTHSPSHHHDAPTSWRTFVDHVRSSSMTSSLLSTQPLPELRVKKPLRFNEQKKERKQRGRRGPLWRYVLNGEETAEDRRRAEVEELVLLEHRTPITRRALHDFLTSSGSTSRHDSSPSMSGTTV